MYGVIRSAWEIREGFFIYDIEIPVNTSGTITLPEAMTEDVTLNSKPVESYKNESVHQSDKGVSLELPSGQYRFKYPFRD